jgi:hypothetical protein
MGELKLLHERFKSEQQHRAATATCLTLTACANFVLIGKPTWVPSLFLFLVLVDF